MQRSPNDLPNPLWLVVPALVIPVALYARSWYLKRKVQKTGIGRGAPGFQTGVKKLAVPPEIAERLKRGEQVSAEEINAAVEGASKQPQPAVSPSAPPTSARVTRSAAHKSTAVAPAPAPTNDWVPDHLQPPKAKKRGGRKKQS